MPAPEAAAYLDRSWILRLFAPTPAVPPFAVGLGVSIAIFASYLAMELATGHLGPLPDGTPLWARADLLNVAVLALLIGYVPTAYCYGLRGIERDAGEIVSQTSDPEQAVEGTFASAFPPNARRRAQIAGIAGMGVGAACYPWVTGDPLVFLRPESWNHHFAWFLAVDLTIFGLFGHLAYLTVTGSRLLRQLGTRSVEVDLLDLSALAPYVRIGLRNALLWLVGISLASLIFLDNEPPIPRREVQRLCTLLAGVVVAAVAFALPVQGVRRRIRAEKQAELARVRAAIRGDRSLLPGSGLAREAAALSVADLVAYRNLIESVREWPFERLTLLRFFLYLVIPVGSWVGGALVERAIGAALD